LVWTLPSTFNFQARRDDIGQWVPLAEVQEGIAHLETGRAKGLAVI
jgi:hypothetical protein